MCLRNLLVILLGAKQRKKREKREKGYGRKSVPARFGVWDLFLTLGFRRYKISSNIMMEPTYPYNHQATMTLVFWLWQYKQFSAMLNIQEVFCFTHHLGLIFDPGSHVWDLMDKSYVLSTERYQYKSIASYIYHKLIRFIFGSSLQTYESSLYWSTWSTFWRCISRDAMTIWREALSVYTQEIKRIKVGISLSGCVSHLNCSWYL